MNNWTMVSATTKYELGIGNRLGRNVFHVARYKGIADTIVQLIRRSISDVISSSKPSKNLGKGR